MLPLWLLMLLRLAAAGCSWLLLLLAAGRWLMLAADARSPARSHQPCPGSFSHTAPLPAPPAGSDGRHDQAHGH